MKSSELFESEIYLEEVSDVMCTAQAGKITFNMSNGNMDSKLIL